MKIRPYQEADRVAVIALWEEAGLALHLNDSRKDIDRKVDFDPDLFLIGEIDGEVVATVMAGSDGHGGWVNQMVVGPSCQRKGYGRLLMEAAEHLLVKRGWPKMNLQVRNKSAEVIKFYCSIGYADAQAIHLGKRLIHDQRIFHKAKQ